MINMMRLTNLTPAEKKFIDDAIAAAERAAGKKLNQPNRHIVLNRARAQIESQRYADRQRALREDERQQSDFSWSRPRAPRRADCGFWRFSGADAAKSPAIHPRA